MTSHDQCLMKFVFKLYLLYRAPSSDNTVNSFLTFLPKIHKLQYYTEIFIKTMESMTP